jgi:hypothetical protein
MSLREYLLRRQAHTRDWMETVRLQTLPLLNAWSKDTITMDDFMGQVPEKLSEEKMDAVKALRYDVEQHTDHNIDWSHVDQQLTDAEQNV